MLRLEQSEGEFPMQTKRVIALDDFAQITFGYPLMGEVRAGWPVAIRYEADTQGSSLPTVINGTVPHAAVLRMEAIAEAALPARLQAIFGSPFSRTAQRPFEVLHRIRQADAMLAEMQSGEDMPPTLRELAETISAKKDQQRDHVRMLLVQTDQEAHFTKFLLQQGPHESLLAAGVSLGEDPRIQPYIEPELITIVQRLGRESVLGNAAYALLTEFGRASLRRSLRA